MKDFNRRPWLVLILVSSISSLNAAETDLSKTERAMKMDYGAFLATSVLKAKRIKPGEKLNAKKIDEPIALKGITIKLDGKTPAAVCFDTDTLAMAAGWSGGFLDFKGTMLSAHKGVDNCTPQGKVAFYTKGMGWGKGNDFKDPRTQALGPLPRDWAKYQGLYVNGSRVVLAYSVANSNVLESPAFETTAGVDAITRSFNLEKSDLPGALCVCDFEGPSGVIVPISTDSSGSGPQSTAKSGPANDSIALFDSGTSTAVGVIGAPAGASLEIENDSVRLNLPAISTPAHFKVVIWSGTKDDAAAFGKSLKEFQPAPDLKAFCQGGTSRWPAIDTQGTPGTGAQPYVLDTLTLPENNPWNAWMRTTGIDFFPDGRAAVCTLNGDVWIVSGIDDKLEKLTWKRFATGLYEPLGLKIVDNKIYVLGRDQITCLHDLNGDGEADFYEDFNSDSVLHHGYNCFAFDLDTDSEGNFYYARCGHQAPPNHPWHGCLIKVSKDGTKSEIVATGLRAANGLCIGPGDKIVSGDNEGEWIPSSKIQFIKKGDFLGFSYHNHLLTPPTDYVKPLCWIPHSVDTSSGGQAWVHSDKWGPLSDHYVHTSFGTSLLMLVLTEEVEGIPQAGVVRIPLVFDTGIMRARVNPHDGQLYVCGVGGGWQTNGVRDGAVHRVRYSGKPVTMPVQLHIEHNGIAIGFSGPLDKTSALDADNYNVEQWLYKWSASYGSPEFSVANPGKKGHDILTVKSVKLRDERTVFIEIQGLQPVMQMQIGYKIKSADGTPVAQVIYNTINRVPAN